MTESAQPVGLYPLVLQPQLHRRVWGGTWLEAFHGHENAVPRLGPAGEPLGESWLASGESVVLNGAHAGLTVAELAGQLGASLVGSLPFGRYGARMPLLAKLLDAATPLSVQVHPDDAYALAHEAASGHLGKTEAWYVLAAEPGAHVLWGFGRDLTPEEAHAAVGDGTLADLMQRVAVTSGSVIVNPAGTVHAVGAGVRLYEIQQESDLTYRLYDYGRVGANGQPRQLHVDKSLAVADLSGRPFVEAPPQPQPSGWVRLVERPEFVLERALLHLENKVRGAATGASLQLLTLVSGSAVLRSALTTAKWPDVRLTPGVTVLLPAALAGGYELTGDGEVLRAYVEHRTEGDAP